MADGGDCRASAPVAKPKAERGRGSEEVQQMRRNDRTLQPLQGFVTLSKRGNLDVDVAGRTSLSDWRRSDR
jgi:hypothetical protein